MRRKSLRSLEKLIFWKYQGMKERERFAQPETFATAIMIEGAWD